MCATARQMRYRVRVMRERWIIAPLVAVLVDCGGSPAPPASPGAVAATPEPVAEEEEAHSNVKSGGQITFISEEEREAYRVEARAGAKLEHLTPALDKLSKGKDRFVNVAPDGSFLLLDTTRFGCDDWGCLALVKADLSEGAAILAKDQTVHPDGSAAVGPGGNVVVYSIEAGTDHPRDLVAIRRKDGAFGAREILSADSPYPFNKQPSISHDGRKVVFDCGPEPYAGDGTAVCEVGTDGAGFRVVAAPGKPGATEKVDGFHHPAYAPDGSIVVEADKRPLGERIWRIPASGEPYLVGELFGNDNSPCVMPDGRVVSLWLGRRGGEGKHELKVMSPDGEDHFMVFGDVEPADVVLGCGAAR